MRAARYDKRISIITQSQQVDATGAPYETWTTAFQRWAEFRPSSSNESYINDQFQSEVNGAIAVRYDKQTKAITTKDRILFNNRTFEIKGLLNPKEQNKEIEIIYEEII